MTVIGVDIGGTYLRAAVVDRANIIDLVKLQHKEKLVPKTTEAITSLLKDRGIESVSVAVACAGHIDHKNSILIHSPNIPSVRNLHLKELLFKSLLERNITVDKIIVENDVNSAVYGEYLFGALRGYKNSAGIFSGTGIGGGLLLGGRLIRGGSGAAAEFGHTIYISNGERCMCGRHGCFEAYASAGGIERLFYKKTKRRLIASEIYELSKQGEKVAVELFEEAVSAIATLILNISASVDVDAVVLGGALFIHCSDLLPRIEAELKSIYGSWVNRPKLILSELGEDAAVIGAASLLTSQDG